MLNEDPQAVNRMLIYLYTNDYPEDDIPSEQRPLATSETTVISSQFNDKGRYHTIMSSVFVFAIAVKYELPALKDLAKEKIRVLIQAVVEESDSARCEVIERQKLAVAEKNAAVVAEKHAVQVLIGQKNRKIEKMDADLRAANEKIKTLKAELNVALEAEKKATKLLISQKTRADVEKDAALYRINEIEKRLGAEKKAALGGEKKAKKQKELVIEQRNKIIRERDAAVALENLNIERVQHFLNQILLWTECRNCGTEFKSYLQRFSYNEELKLQLRCLNCLCRHDLGAGLG